MRATTALLASLCVTLILVLSATELEARPGRSHHVHRRPVRTVEEDGFEEVRSHQAGRNKGGVDTAEDRTSNDLADLIKKLESNKALQDEDSPTAAANGQRTPSVGMAIVSDDTDPDVDLMTHEFMAEGDLSQIEEESSEAFVRIRYLEQQKHELQKAVDALQKELDEVVSAGAEAFYPRETVHEEEEENDAIEKTSSENFDEQTEEEARAFENENHLDSEPIDDGEMVENPEENMEENTEETPEEITDETPGNGFESDQRVEPAKPSYTDGVEENDSENPTSEEMVADEMIPEEDGETTHSEETVDGVSSEEPAVEGGEDAVNDEEVPGREEMHYGANDELHESDDVA